MSDLSAFSFYPTKILGGDGDGGMVLTDDKALRAIAAPRCTGGSGSTMREEHGYNRLDELHAAILSKKLGHLDAYIPAARRWHRDEASLSDTTLTLPADRARKPHAYYLYVARHPQRDQIVEELAKRDIMVDVSYRYPIHTMRAYTWLGYHEGDLPHTGTP